MHLSASELAEPVAGVESFVDTADGTRLRTLVAGDGPAVVLAHGYGVDLTEWHLVARRLVAQGRRVVLFDQRGHGASSIGSQGISSAAMASDYLAVLEHHAVEQAVLVGHSMGGFLALRFLLLHPEAARRRVAHALLLATFAGRVNDGAPQNRLQLPLIRSGLMQWLIGFPALGRGFTRSLVGLRYTDAMAEVFVPVFRGANHAALVPILAAMAAEDHYPELAGLAVPCTVMVGDRDRTTPAFHSQTMARLIPGATLRTLPGVGHLANWEAADTLAETVLALT